MSINSKWVIGDSMPGSKIVKIVKCGRKVCFLHKYSSIWYQINVRRLSLNTHCYCRAVATACSACVSRRGASAARRSRWVCGSRGNITYIWNGSIIYCLTQSEWESTMLQEGQPENVMYGWCVKCRLRYQEKFQALRGWGKPNPKLESQPQCRIRIDVRTACTYCGGSLEDNYPAAAIALAVLCFPVGILGCLVMKE